MPRRLTIDDSSMRRTNWDEHCRFLGLSEVAAEIITYALSRQRESPERSLRSRSL
jgi:hypothetical protein